MARTIVVTGSSRGIGAEIVRTFAKEKANIVINYTKSQKEAEELAEFVKEEGGNAICVKANVGVAKDCKFLIDEAIKVFGRVDVLVCNAGISNASLLIDASDELVEKIIDVNLLGVINTCKHAVKNMMSNGYGKIINISSMWGITGGSSESVYSGSKAGVIGFSKALAKEAGLSNINVNVVAPGVILTDMCKNIPQNILDGLAKETALNKLGQPKDIANVVEFLASDKASYITGQVISVDGGFVI